MIRPRRLMNRMNRAMLDAASSNPAEIAQAACGSGNLPDYVSRQQNPRGVGGGGGMAAGRQGMGNPKWTGYRSRAPHYGGAVGTGQVASNLLSNAQKLWLHRRALWFGGMLVQFHEPVAWPPTDIADFAGTAAAFAATALVGDDYDPITKGPTAGWSASQFTAAFDYVNDNMDAWWTDAYGG